MSYCSLHIRFSLVFLFSINLLFGQNSSSRDKIICGENLQFGFIPFDREVTNLPRNIKVFKPIYDTVENLYITINSLDYLNNIRNHNTIVVDSLSDRYRYEFSSYKVNEEIPTTFLNYTISYYQPLVYGLVTIVDKETGKTVKFPSLKKKFDFFPDSISTFENSFLIIKRNPSFFGCTSEGDSAGLKPFHSLFNKCIRNYFDFSFGYFEGIYRAKLYCLWESEYKIFLRCRVITDTENCNDLNKKIKDEIIARMNNNYLMHKSYFKLIFWQLYKPNDFKVKDNKGKKRSFIFTSNNADYPGNYEVKFNIYEPYNFKVFKR